MSRLAFKIYSVVLLTVFSFLHGVSAATIASDIPPKPDVDGVYLFYLHSKQMELQGIPARHHKYGEYAYLDILKRLQAEGMNVVAEWRPTGAKIHPYAFRIARRVTQLIEKGVPSKNIIVAGVDKGGKIALLVSSYVGEAAVNYIILGGCPANQQEAQELVENFELMPSGRILSIHDSGHKKSGPCSPLLKQTEQGTQYQDLIVSSGMGQGVFYRPDKRWIEPLLRWAKGEPL